MKHETTNERLAALRKRDERLRAIIAAEITLEQRRQARERERVVRIVGEALLEEESRSPTVRTLLKQTLSTVVVDEKSRRLLVAKGLL